MKKLKVVLMGAGGRGVTYTDIMAKMPEKFEVVAVAEPLDNRRNHVRELHNIPDDMCFTDWRPLLELGKIADVALICTMDRDHLEASIKSIELGYDLLLEKPIAPEPLDCKMITECAIKNNKKVVICTVLRYTDIFTTVKDMIDSGKLGKVMSINHEECVGNTHQSHSFVRGNWGNSKRSSTMLLQKSCHDMDLLQWLIGKKCKKVQSFGMLSHFRKENAPEGAPEYCVQGCPAEETCPYSAKKVYFNCPPDHWFRTGATKHVAPTDEIMMDCITNTNYGRCAYKCDNDVVDHQTVNLLFEDDITVTFTMNAFNKGGRYLHIMGTKGELRAQMDGESPIKFYDFLTEKTETIDVVAGDGISSGHGGGDTGIVEDFYDYINGNYTGKSIPSIEESYYNHLITFAAEEARLTGKVIDFDEYVKTI